ncbi:MAG TPA: hypothetical protein VHU40_10400 [Polyangia bacterium]|nr:hypothetical protein [Polyangia bacterium]
MRQRSQPSPPPPPRFAPRGLRWILGLALSCGAARAVAAEPHPSSRADADAIAKLDRQVRELRALLADVQRSEREHFETLRRLLDRTGAAAAGSPGEVKVVSPETTAAPSEAGGEGTAAAASPTEAKAAPVALATVTGRVSVKGPLRDVYVYLEGFRSNAGRKAEIEVVQTHKSFEPAFSVALVGTRATFPNRDTFFHNVFSTTPAPFDLGTYRADETPPSVTLKTPGVVELSCNIHAQMRAQILVVPNRVYTRVADDGTFKLDKVPAGRRKLVAWGPGLRAARVEVNVPARGAAVTIDLEPEVPTRHLNKFGLPYGAYRD